MEHLLRRLKCFQIMPSNQENDARKDQRTAAKTLDTDQMIKAQFTKTFDPIASRYTRYICCEGGEGRETKLGSSKKTRINKEIKHSSNQNREFRRTMWRRIPQSR